MSTHLGSDVDDFHALLQGVELPNCNRCAHQSHPITKPDTSPNLVNRQFQVYSITLFQRFDLPT